MASLPTPAAGPVLADSAGASAGASTGTLVGTLAGASTGATTGPLTGASTDTLAGKAAVPSPVDVAARPSVAARLRRIVTPWLLPLGLLLAWDVAVRLTRTQLIPLPYDVALMLVDFTVGGVYDDAFSETLPLHVWKSVTRVYGGFFSAALVGIPLGLLIGRIKLIRDVVDPTLQLLRPVPVTAWLPLSMIFFGLGPNAAIFLVFLGAFYPIVFNTTFGVRAVDHRLFEASAMLGCKGPAMFRQVVLPAAMPSILNGLRLGHGFAWILIVVGEMTGVPEGLGAVIMDGRMLSRTDLVIAGMIVIGLAGFLTDRVLVMINNRLLKWSPQHHV